MCLLPVVMSHCEDSGEKSFEKKEKPGSNCRLKIAQYSYSWRLWWCKGSSSLKHDTLSHSEEQMLEECQKIRRLGCKGIRQSYISSPLVLVRAISARRCVRIQEMWIDDRLDVWIGLE